MAAASAAGVDAHLPCQSTFPSPSTMQIEVCSSDTSKPT
jgi:hypothetical protein